MTTTKVLTTAKATLQVYDPETRALVRITKQAFLKDWALPIVQKRYIHCQTALSCIKSQAPCIGLISKSFGEDFIQAYIEGWIVNLRNFFNVGKGMTDEQTFETAMMVVQEYPNLNIADINLIFKNAKIGRYGKLYDRLDGQMILQWIDEYFELRCNEAAEDSIREAESMSIPVEDSPQRVRKMVDLALNSSRR